jgi:hypothetical protein
VEALQSEFMTLLGKLSSEIASDPNARSAKSSLLQEPNSKIRLRMAQID